MIKQLLVKLRHWMNEHNISRKGLICWTSFAAALLILCCVLAVGSPTDSNHIFPVYINEVLASNTAYPNEDGRCSDYIELYNAADYPIDLSGFQLGDIAGSSRYAFPVGSVIDAQSYFVVYCDKTVEEYAPFGISRSGDESFYLIASNNAIVDSVLTVATDADQSMIRLSSGDWAVTDTPTPGRDNSTAVPGDLNIYNPGVSPVRITEFSSTGAIYVPAYGLSCDWIELHNTADSAADISGYTLSDNMGNDKYRFPEGTVLPAGGYLVVYCSDALEAEGLAPFSLAQTGGESIIMKTPQGMIVETVRSLPMEFGSMALGDDGVWTLCDIPSPGFENTAAGHTALLESIGAVPGTVVISEVMASSQFILPDQSGQFPDWVELRNTGDTPVDLTGWFLSDDSATPDKWVFPQLVLQPGQRFVVFCSGTGAVSGDTIHTDFALSAGGENLILSSYLGTPVDEVAFGQSQDGCSFIFENGEEWTMCSSPTPGYSNDADGYEQFMASQSPAGPLAIWEVMTFNNDYLPQALGACYDWVELRNISQNELRLSDYTLTDDPNFSNQYILPDKTLSPGESIVIILSGDVALSNYKYDHAGFSLDANMEQLLLYDHSGNLKDFVYLANIPIGCSYGRQDSGGFAYMEPTPEADNLPGHRQISGEPTSEVAQGVYTVDSGFVVPLSAVGNIYYTTDGSQPDLYSTPYTGPIQITQTTVLRAIAVEPGKGPSGTYTATFLVGTSHEIPVVSLVTDPANLWGPDGIYKDGDINIKEEKRPANVAYLGTDGSFSMDCELKMHGTYTLTNIPKKSFSVRFLDAYDGPLNYDVFEDGEVTTFRSLILRGAYEGEYPTHLHDTLMSDVAARNCDTLIAQKYKYVALYINGEYWGLYAIRELQSDEHFASYMDVPVSSVSKVKYCFEDNTTLNRLYNFCENNSLQAPQDYEYAKTVLDMTSYADWIIFQAYGCNIDITGNMRYYHCTVDNLWRCGLVDLDMIMTSPRAFDEVADTFHHGRIVSALLQNEEFQALLATRLAELLAGPLSDENMIATIDAMANIIRPEIPLECERWGSSPEIWELFVGNMKEYCDGRALAMIDSLCALCGFTEAERLAYFGDLL